MRIGVFFKFTFWGLEKRSSEAIRNNLIIKNLIIYMSF